MNAIANPILYVAHVFGALVALVMLGTGLVQEQTEVFGHGLVLLTVSMFLFHRQFIKYRAIAIVYIILCVIMVPCSLYYATTISDLGGNVLLTAALLKSIMLTIWMLAHEYKTHKDIYKVEYLLERMGVDHQAHAELLEQDTFIGKTTKDGDHFFLRVWKDKKGNLQWKSVALIS